MKDLLKKIMAVLVHQKKKLSINFSKTNTKLYFISLSYNGDNNCLLVNRKEIYKLKANNKNINFPNQFCLGNISNEFEDFEAEEVSL